MAPNEPGLYYPVPPIPPKPPQVTLLGSSISPPSNDVIDNDQGVLDAKLTLKNASDQFAKADSLEEKQSATDSVDAAYEGVLNAVAMAQANLAKQLGLLPVELRAELDLDNDEKWVRGFAYLPENGSAAINRAPGDVTTVDDPTEPPNLAKVEVQPWDVGVKMSASSLNGEEQIDYLGRVQRQSDAAAPYGIEYEFWTGELAQANSWPNNYLASSNSEDITPTPGTPVTMAEGLGLIQSYLSNTGFGGQGMIHLVPEAAPNLLNSRRVGKFLLDQFDNIIVPGVGYQGTGPTGDAPPTGQTWIYGTDLVAVRLQKNPVVFPKLLSQALDRSEGGNPNLITFRATRFAAAYWDNLRAAGVLVYLPGYS
jgi:hypothetical protein